MAKFLKLHAFAASVFAGSILPYLTFFSINYKIT